MNAAQAPYGAEILDLGVVKVDKNNYGVRFSQAVRIATALVLISTDEYHRFARKHAMRLPPHSNTVQTYLVYRFCVCEGSSGTLGP